MIANAKNAGIAGTFYFDNGTEANFITHSFCKQNNIAFQSSKYSAGKANGTKQALFALTNLFETQIYFYTEEDRFALSRLERYHAILRKQWLASQKAVIFSENNKIHLKEKPSRL